MQIKLKKKLPTEPGWYCCGNDESDTRCRLVVDEGGGSLIVEHDKMTTSKLGYFDYWSERIDFVFRGGDR